MLQVASAHALDAIEGVIRRAAHHNDASVLSILPVGHLVREKTTEDAIVFTIGQPELYAALLAADVRTAALLPCRIAAWPEGGKVTLAAVSPLECCRLLNRPDLAPLADPLEALLRSIMEEAARPVAATAHAASGAQRGGLGATEDQMNVRGSIPQRIDRRGTKVEDMAGTGEHDAKGG
jgi:uncharacterized protein (DUF302 family)